MQQTKEQKKQLELWQSRAAKSENAYGRQLRRMEERELQYLGDETLSPLVDGDDKAKTVHVRNITSEMIESQVDSNIPQPKVTPRRPEDSLKAKLIEDMIRAELDRMPFEEFNDMLERTVPIQGGGLFLVEWDSTARTHTTTGELKVSPLHPKQVIPQSGVYTGIQDMDYIILRLPQTKESIERLYGIKLDETINFDGAEPDDELVTQYTAYYKDENGNIGKFSWVNETILEDIPDCQSRHVQRCNACGTQKPHNSDRCPVCSGAKFTDEALEYEDIPVYAEKSDGTVIPPSAFQSFEEPDTLESPDDSGEISYLNNQNRVPVYRPGLYPVILQKNVSVYGKFLGESDCDKIKYQQNTVNRLESKIIDKLMKSGSYISLPPDADIEVDTEDMKVIRLVSPAGKQMMGVYDMQGNIEQDAAYLEQVYQESRQITGITDSLQGRRDTTATSGKAKEFAAAQSAGRLESKRVLKNAAYASLFEAIFKFKLAYTDEPRPVPSHDTQGNPDFKTFNRYDFLEQDDSGQWYWNDQFLFSCDSTAPLASNREAMWQETNSNFQSGAFGDPSQLDTLVLFWKKMEMLHYPGAGETRSYLEQKSLEEQAVPQLMPVQDAGLAPQAVSQVAPQADMPFNM